MKTQTKSTWLPSQVQAAEAILNPREIKWAKFLHKNAH